MTYFFTLVIKKYTVHSKHHFSIKCSLLIFSIKQNNEIYIKYKEHLSSNPLHLKYKNMYNYKSNAPQQNIFDFRSLNTYFSHKKQTFHAYKLVPWVCAQAWQMSQPSVNKNSLGSCLWSCKLINKCNICVLLNSQLCFYSLLEVKWTCLLLSAFCSKDCTKHAAKNCFICALVCIATTRWHQS